MKCHPKELLDILVAHLPSLHHLWELKVLPCPTERPYGKARLSIGLLEGQEEVREELRPVHMVAASSLLWPGLLPYSCGGFVFCDKIIEFIGRNKILEYPEK